MTATEMPPAFHEVARRVHRIDLPLGERFVSLYLIVGDDGVMLFDVGVTGMIGEYVLPSLESLGIDPMMVRHVVLSHCDVDHFGGAADARAAFPAARIVAHELDAPAIEDFATYVSDRADSFHAFGWREDPDVLAWARSATAEIALDETVTGGEEIDLGGIAVRILHVPGHSEGHLAVHVPDARALLVSDAVLGRSVDLADGTPAFPPTYRFVDDYLASIRTLEQIGAEFLLTAHYPTLAGNEAEMFLRDSRDFAVDTEELVLSAVREAGASTFAEVLARVNPLAGRWPTEGTLGALAYPVAGHLERLEANGALVSEGDGDARVWRGR